MNLKKLLTQNSISYIFLVLIVTFIVFWVTVYLSNLENSLKENDCELKVISSIEKINEKIDTQHKFIIKNILENNIEKNHIFYENKKEILKMLSTIDNKTNNEDELIKLKGNYKTFITEAEEFLIKENENQNKSDYFQKIYQSYNNLNESISIFSAQKINQLYKNQIDTIDILKEAKLVIILMSVLSVVLGILYIMYITKFIK